MRNVFNLFIHAFFLAVAGAERGPRSASKRSTSRGKVLLRQGIYHHIFLVSLRLCLCVQCKAVYAEALGSLDDGLCGQVYRITFAHRHT